MSASPTAPDGRKLLRLEVRNAQTPIERKPEWIKTKATMGPEYTELKKLVKSEGLHTVCQEAGCPNIYECWEDREATFLIGGDQCTRRCDFCQIDTGKPEPLDRDEPRRVAESVRTMGLRYATITGVARDDLPDGGAWLYAETVKQIHELNPGTGVENLIPDFNARPEQLAEVFDSRPEVLAHNVETVPRIFKRIRPAFRYDRSLGVLTSARDVGLVTKSNLILGMGETREEVSQALRDLHDAGCELITITQYLRPSPRHHPVERWVKPEEFVELSSRGRGDRLLRRALGPAGAFVLPRRPAVPSGDGRPRGRTRLSPPALPTTTDTRTQPTMAREKKQKKQKKAYDPNDPSSMNRRQQLAATYRMTKQTDPRIGLWLLGAFVVSALVGFALFWVLPGGGTVGLVLAVIGGVLLGVLGVLVIFGRRAQAAAYDRMHGQPGAAASALTMLRRGWKTDPMVAFNRQQDVVHRVIGPPGIVLVGEGNPTRLRGLLPRGAPQARAGRLRHARPRDPVRRRRGTGTAPPAGQAGAQAGSQGQAGRDDRRHPPAQGPRCAPLGRPDAQGPGPAEHEGSAGQPARSLSRFNARRSRARGRCPA